ncbi:MAG: hypothetical protein K6G61_11790 [Solobacterium sp.]|nr:hypothetical protein [Solobacterium sp.]
MLRKILTSLTAFALLAAVMPVQISAEETGETAETFESGSIESLEELDLEAILDDLIEEYTDTFYVDCHLNGGTIDYDVWVPDVIRYVSKDGQRVVYRTETLEETEEHNSYELGEDDYYEWMDISYTVVYPPATEGLTRKGYKFDGWYLNNTFEGEKNIFGYYYRYDMTGGDNDDYAGAPIHQDYYAKWIEVWKKGWREVDKGWKYSLEKGNDYTNGVYKIGKKYYGFDTKGFMVKGWKKFSGKWYYFTSSGAAVTGWKKLSGKWYWFNSEGKMVTSWNKISGKWYYFNGSGAMLTGWQKIGKKWYYFLSGGAMVTGWKKIGAKWYYFQFSGVMKTGWLKLGGKWYYFNSSGAMVTGTVKIGSKTYTFNSSGVCQNP